MSAPVLLITRLQKNYSGLRPLRIRDLAIAAGERVAVTGFDAPGAELLVNLVTGAAVPDEGDVSILGQRTADITNGDEWLASLDRFGIVSSRAVMMDGATLAQNLAMPFTLEIDPIPGAVRARVDALAVECGISGPYAQWMDRLAGEAPAEVRARVHLGRGVALDPQLLVLEHPTAGIEAAAVLPLAADVKAVAERRGIATLIITNDEAFAGRAAQRTLVLNGATGELAPLRKKWFW